MTKIPLRTKHSATWLRPAMRRMEPTRGGDSAVGIWRVPCGESVAKMQIVMKGMKKVETEKSKPVFGGPAGSGNDASDASHAGFCG